jgi:hypothetical protein
MKILLHKDYDEHTSITIEKHEKNRISVCVYAGDGGWVHQYENKTFEEVCANQRKVINQKIRSKSCTRSALEKLLNFNQTELF